MLAVGAALGGCAFNLPQKSVAERFELRVPAQVSTAGLAVSEISVSSPSWLQTPSMGYRLRFSKSSRREVYTLSRWVAPPSEMVLNGLKRGLPLSGASGCRMKVELDEFVHDFTTSQESVGRIEIRVRLLPPRGEQGALSRRFEWVSPATFPDAPGGAEALNTSLNRGVAEISAWLSSLKSNPATATLCGKA
jgi:cholesterol transport system auxiliary component